MPSMASTLGKGAVLSLPINQRTSVRKGDMEMDGDNGDRADGSRELAKVPHSVLPMPHGIAAFSGGLLSTDDSGMRTAAWKEIRLLSISIISIHLHISFSYTNAFVER